MSARSVRPTFRFNVTAVQDTLSATRIAVRLPDRTTVARIARRLRARHLAVIDLIGIVVASYAALSLHFESPLSVDGVMRFLPAMLLVLSVRTIINVRLGLYSRRWRFASVPDLERIVAAVALGSLVAVAIFYGVRPWRHGLGPTGSRDRSGWQRRS